MVSPFNNQIYSTKQPPLELIMDTFMAFQINFNPLTRSFTFFLLQVGIFLEVHITFYIIMVKV